MMNRLEPSPRKPAASRTPQLAVRPATAQPRPVAGPEGRRISLQMGKSGDEYLLLLDEDDGDDEWQTRSSSSLPDDLVTQLDRLQAANHSVREVGLGPAGEWFVHGVARDGTGAYSWWDGDFAASRQLRQCTGELQVRLQLTFGEDGRWLLLQGHNGFACSKHVNAALQARIRRVHAKKGSIGCVRLLPGDGYFITDDTEGTLLFGARADLAAEVCRPTGDPIVDVVCDGTDGAAWVVLRRNWFRASAAVAPALSERLCHFYIAQHQRRRARESLVLAYHRGASDFARARAARERARWQRKLRSAAAAQQQAKAQQQAGGAAQAQQLQLRQQDAQLSQLRRELELLATAPTGRGAVAAREAAQWQALLEQNILARREEKEREIEAEHAGAVVGLMRAAGLA